MDSCNDLIPRRIIFDAIDGIDAMHTFDMQSFCFDEDNQISLTIDFKFDTPLDRDGKIFHGTIFGWLLRQLPFFSLSNFDAYQVENFRGAVFDGLLRQLPNLFLSNSRRTSIGKFSWSDLRWTSSQTSNFFLSKNLDAHSVGKFSVSDLRWTSSPTSNFFLWAILDAHRLGSFRETILEH